MTSAQQRRALAIVILVAVVALPSWLVLWPLVSGYMALGEEIADKRFAVQKLENLLSRQVEIQFQLDELAALDSTATFALEASTATLAFANLQTQVNRTLQLSGGEMRSTRQAQISDELQLGELRGVGLRASMRMTLPQLVRFIHEAENSRPMLFVTEMAVRAPPTPAQPNDDVELDVETTLVGYWLPPDTAAGASADESDDE